MAKVSVVIPNWNGKDSLGACLDSLLAQTLKPHIIVVENGSIDGSLEFVQKKYPSVELVMHAKNLGFAGGVNGGIRRALERNDDFVALFNNDAIASKNWLSQLVKTLEAHKDAGIVTCKLQTINGDHLDSTGDMFTVWGLPYPRGRDEPVSDAYDHETAIFGASGGASLYRTSMLRQVGLFDEDFFAYYEDVDISFRAQLVGWKVRFAPAAIAYHQIGATSGKIKDFTTYQTLKNLPMVVWKNVPVALLPKVLPRFWLAYTFFCVRAAQRGQLWAIAKALGKLLLLLPKKTWQRWHIQHNKKVPVKYIWGIFTHDLPPNAHKLRTLRSAWWRLTGRGSKADG